MRVLHLLCKLLLVVTVITLVDILPSKANAIAPEVCRTLLQGDFSTNSPLTIEFSGCYQLGETIIIETGNKTRDNENPPGLVRFLPGVGAKLRGNGYKIVQNIESGVLIGVAGYTSTVYFVDIVVENVYRDSVAHTIHCTDGAWCTVHNLDASGFAGVLLSVTRDATLNVEYMKHNVSYDRESYARRGTAAAGIAVLGTADLHVRDLQIIAADEFPDNAIANNYADAQIQAAASGVYQAIYLASESGSEINARISEALISGSVQLRFMSFKSLLIDDVSVECNDVGGTCLFVGARENCAIGYARINSISVREKQRPLFSALQQHRRNELVKIDVFDGCILCSDFADRSAIEIRDSVFVVIDNMETVPVVICECFGKCHTLIIFDRVFISGGGASGVVIGSTEYAHKGSVYTIAYPPRAHLMKQEL